MIVLTRELEVLAILKLKEGAKSFHKGKVLPCLGGGGLQKVSDP